MAAMMTDFGEQGAADASIAVVLGDLDILQDQVLRSAAGCSGTTLQS